jgi:ribosomal protein L9
MQKTYMLGIALLLATSCANKSETKNVSENFNHVKTREEATSSSTEKKSKQLETELEKTFISKAATVGNDSLHLFIKKATIEALAKNLFQSSIQLEDSCIALGGYIENSTISKEVSQENNIQVKRDSILSIQKYRLNNSLSVRIPHQQLHRFLKIVQRVCDKIEYRHVRAENVALDLWKEKRTQDIIQAHTAQFDGKNIKVDSDVLLNQKMQQLEAELEEKKLEEDIRFSQVNLTLRSDFRLEKKMSPILPQAQRFSAPLSEQFNQAFHAGWFGFMSLLIGLTHIWFIFVLVSLSWLIWKRLKNKKTGAN